MERRAVLKGVLGTVVGLGAVALGASGRTGLSVATAHAFRLADASSGSARVATSRTVQIPPPTGSTTGTSAAQLAFGPSGAYFILGDALAFYDALARTTSRIPLAHTGKTYDAYLSLTYNPVTHRLVTVHNIDGSHFIQTLNPTSGAILTSIPVPDGFSADAVGVVPTTGKIVAAIENAGSPPVRALLIIKSDGQATGSGILISEGVRQLIVHPSNGRVTGFVPLFGTDDGLVITINSESGAVVKELTTPGFAYGGAALDPVRQRVLLPTVNDQGTGTLIVAPLDGSRTSTVSVGTSLQVAAHPTTGQAYVLADDSVYEFDPQATGSAALTPVALPTRSPQSYTPTGFVIDGYAGVAYVRGRMNGQLVLDELPS